MWAVAINFFFAFFAELLSHVAYFIMGWEHDVHTGEAVAVSGAGVGVREVSASEPRWRGVQLGSGSHRFSLGPRLGSGRMTRGRSGASTQGEARLTARVVVRSLASLRATLLIFGEPFGGARAGPAGLGRRGRLGSRPRGSAASDRAVMVGSVLTSGQWYGWVRTKRGSTEKAGPNGSTRSKPGMGHP